MDETHPEFATRDHSKPITGGSNEFPQSMFWSKIKKDRYTPAYHSFSI